MVLRGEQPHDVQKPTVSSAQEEMSVGCHPALGTAVGRSTGSCPQGDFNGVPHSKMGALGLVKSTSLWCWSPLGTNRFRGRHRRLPKLLGRFSFLQQSQFTNSSQSAPPLCRLCRPPGEDDGQGATALRKGLCCRAQPLNSATFREPHTCFKGLLFALESSSEMARLQTLNTSVCCQELPACSCTPAKAGRGPCVELPRFWGGGGRDQGAACARHSLCGG